MMENNNSTFHNHIFEKIVEKLQTIQVLYWTQVKNSMYLDHCAWWAWNEKTNSHTIIKIWEVCDKTDAD